MQCDVGLCEIAFEAESDVICMMDHGELHCRSLHVSVQCHQGLQPKQGSILASTVTVIVKTTNYLLVRGPRDIVCEPNVVQLRAHRLGILLYKFREEFDLHDTSMGPNPEGFKQFEPQY